MATLLAAEKDPSIRDHQEFAEAQALVSSVKELEAVFEAEKAFYQHHDGLLSSVTLPTEARARIANALSAAESNLVTAAGTDAETAEPAPVTQMPRSRLFMLAAAAVLALAGIVWVASALRPAAPQGETFRDFASMTVENGISLSSYTPTLKASSEWLADSSGPAPAEPAGRLSDFPSKGCTIVDWNGTKVSIICMKQDKGPMVHLFVVDRSQLSDTALAALTGRGTSHKRETYGWADGKNAYVLVSGKPNRPLTIPPGLVVSSG